MRAAGFDPDEWQVNLLRSDPRRNALLLCGRQVGKSTGTSFLAVGEALLRPASTTLLISPAQRQSGELLLKVKNAVNALGRPVGVINESATALGFANGSRVLSLPASEGTIRGYSADLLIVDEAAKVPDEILGAIRPMLAATGGRFVVLSSAFARSGWFYDLWTDGGPDWLRLSVKSSECPRIAPEFLAEERKILGATIYAMEYENVFGDSIFGAFSYADIARAVEAGANVQPLFAADPLKRESSSAPGPEHAGDAAVKPLFVKVG